ncbi:MAG: Gfo/Idh/MocA family oxidoreductase [Phycisphaerae bacterium]|nr:Gfo/Idh/MocA family oxidoreductase [Phycisphaerae bacterium]
MSQPLTFGMVGGGRDAFIGAVHRMAAQLDAQARFVAGALSSTPEKAVASGGDLGLAADRNYRTWEEMLDHESRRPPAERIDFVSIVTPNHAHFEPALAFVRAGFHVVLDKPMVLNSTQADELVAAVDKVGVVFGVTYNYTGYPMVKQAAAMVRDGAIGPVRKVFAHYRQGWLATRLESTGQKQAGWRTDPARAGAGAVGDIGSHAENLVSTITGLTLHSLCADVSTFVPGRAIDDDASVLLRFAGGAKGVLTCSQVCVGHENDLAIRVCGEKGTLSWRQEHPNHLEFTPMGAATRVLTRAGPDAGPAAAAATRIPSGHPEGFIEAFANVYRGVIEAVRAQREGRKPAGLATQFPTVRDGARGVRFVERVLESGRAGGRWLTLE